MNFKVSELHVLAAITAITVTAIIFITSLFIVIEYNYTSTPTFNINSDNMETTFSTICKDGQLFWYDDTIYKTIISPVIENGTYKECTP